MEAWIPPVTGVLTLVCALLFGIIAIKSKHRYQEQASHFTSEFYSGNPVGEHPKI